MNKFALISLAATLGLSVANVLLAQEPAEESETASTAHSAEHDVIREAHRAAMQQQMQQIQQIEDPEERQRRMEELRAAMGAMRDAMRSAHHPECASGDACDREHGNRDRGQNHGEF